MPRAEAHDNQDESISAGVSVRHPFPAELEMGDELTPIYRFSGISTVSIT